MSVLYLIRHGQASFGQDDYDQLSQLGVRQSHILGQHLIETGFQPDALYCGPLRRHKATAEEFLACYQFNGGETPKPEVMVAFDEYDTAAIISAMTKDDRLLRDQLPRIYSSNTAFKKVFETATLRWASGEFPGNGFETWDELKDRVVRALKTIMKTHGRGKTIAVFTSGGAIAASLSYVLGLSGEYAMRLNWQIVNTSVTRFMYDDERITLAGFNSIAHLELLRDPSLITYR